MRDRVSPITAFAAGQINGSGPPSAFFGVRGRRPFAVRLALNCLRLGILKPKSDTRPSNLITAFCVAAFDEHVAEMHAQRVAGCELSLAAVAAVAKLLAGHLLVFRLHRGADSN